MEGRFNGGFFALPVWGAYIWRGLYMEELIFGILRYISIQWIAQFDPLILNYWIAIYPMDSAIHRLNAGTTTVTLKNSP